ncbi:type VII secretion AAA-ATPase EccA [Mycobacterium sp. M1]|uniref:Type VII secretion AAA-ATPase EccA n=1 Tax=Mycolicibacter acidiphilus TaxID=2835306 RepID=A0ABS5RP61_9MYCO|nr:type VII secretion AAA-ATPase EccA [Mycolicibacter acidiphilus]MBS9535994.1 type VII secretion AAA-ATPase EccA [Mycolicibacter acidiphilus]
MTSTERALPALQAAIKAMPGAPQRAAQVFELATTDDPGMADAWLGRVATGDKSLATLQQVAELADRIGTHLRMLGLSPLDLGAAFHTDYVRLPIADATSARLCYAAALITQGRYADASVQLDAADGSPAAAYVRAVLYRYAERWPDVLTALAGCANWLDATLRRAGCLLEGLAAANLGLFDRAVQALAVAEIAGAADDITRDALLCRALLARHRGETDEAQTLLTDMRVRWPSFEPAQSALADPSYGLSVTDQATIDSRTDRWDATTAMTAAQRAAQESAGEAKAQLVEAEQQLNNMIGLGEVKKRIATLRADSIARSIRQRRGLPTAAVSRHLLMIGPPGVGKTESARVVAKMFCGLGVLSRPTVYETKKASLVGRHLGDTENNTMELLQKALGATVFIDEFGDLVGRGYSGGDAYGEAIIATLVPWMENERGNTVIIGAGYPRASQRVLAANDGLQSRFSTIIEYHSYNPDELIAIAEGIAGQFGDTLEPGAADRVLREPFSNYYNSQRTNEDGDVIRQIDLLGNGRFVRTVIERAQEARNEHLVDRYGLGQIDWTDETAGGDIADDVLVQLSAADLHAGYLAALPPELRETR